MLQKKNQKLFALIPHFHLDAGSQKMLHGSPVKID